MSVREIKFRAWNVDDEIMLYSDFNAMGFYSLENAQEIAENTETVFMYHAYTGDKDFVLLQYTGLKDKNGVEIYEGDILQYKAYSVIKRWWSTMEEIEVIKAEVEEQRKNFYMCVGEVSYADGDLKIGFDLSGKDLARGERIEMGSGRNGDYERKKWDFEVIGNIYENPKLLEVNN